MMFKWPFVRGMTRGSSLSGIFLQRIKALGRMGMVTNPILYSECMYRYTGYTLSLTDKEEGDPEIFLLRNQ